jgi:threonine/homoserine/homoserine lactone efflux protein
MVSFLVTGTILGLSAGFAPGPLLTLVIAETIEHGAGAGVKVALAPIVTDLPIIILSLYLLSSLTGYRPVLGVISVAGALFILFLGVENTRVRGVRLDEGGRAPRSLRKGIVVNALSPHPYLFWLSVGGPTTVRALQTGPSSAAAFVVGFYLFLVGSKLALAVLAGRSRAFLQGRRYIMTMRFLGLVLMVLAGFLFRDGLVLLGLLRAD